MLDDVVGYLVCPQCGAALSRAGTVLRCASRHSFDIARQGYVSLLPAGGRADAGDTAAMVQARAGFLAAGHYAELAGLLARAAADVVTGTRRPAGPGAPVAPGVPVGEGVPAGTEAPARPEAPGCVVDVGAGPGYYLAAALDQVPGRAGLALDASKFALRRAARAHPRIGAVGADAWHPLPVADASAAVVLNVFAPRNGAELRRILHPDGRLLVVTPNPEHLGELVGPLRLLVVDPRKDERLAGTLSPHFDLAERRRYDASLRLDHQEVAAVVAMGQTARHADAGALADRIRGLPGSMPVTVSVTLWCFRPARAAAAPGAAGS
jgi:23S rRNA (guanine745-N1)-methyltransferase